MENFIEDEHGNAITSQDIADYRLEQGESSGSQRKEGESSEKNKDDDLPEKMDIQYTEDVSK